MGISLIGYDRVELAKKGCNRCGSKSVAWKESNQGKWYLIEAFDFDGEPRANYKDFHSGYCDKPELHAVKQSQISSALGIEEEERATLAVATEERKAAVEAEFFLALHDLCKNNPHGARMEIEMREREIEAINRNPPTMDYMVEFTQTMARLKRLTLEIEFMQAALGLVTE